MAQEQQIILWRVAVVAGVVIALIAAGAFLVLRRGGGNVTGKENARIDYDMRFTYLGSEENVPLENLALTWSAPKVDNSLPEFLGGVSTWLLYYIEDDNSLTLQANMGGAISLRGARASQLGMYQFGYEYTEDGPVYNAWFDRLYPREVFVRWGYGIVNRETAEKVTLKVCGQTSSTASWYPVGQENQRIDFSLWSGLWRDNVLVEQWRWDQENGAPASYWLWPVPII